MGGTGTQASNVTAGLPGFLVVFALALVCWFLFRDMSKRLRNIRRPDEVEGRRRAQGEIVAEPPAEQRAPHDPEGPAV